MCISKVRFDEITAEPVNRERFVLERPENHPPRRGQDRWPSETRGGERSDVRVIQGTQTLWQPCFGDPKQGERDWIRHSGEGRFRTRAGRDQGPLRARESPAYSESLSKWVLVEYLMISCEFSLDGSTKMISENDWTSSGELPRNILGDSVNTRSWGTLREVEPARRICAILDLQAQGFHDRLREWRKCEASSSLRFRRTRVLSFLWSDRMVMWHIYLRWWDLTADERTRRTDIRGREPQNRLCARSMSEIVLLDKSSETRSWRLRKGVGAHRMQIVDWQAWMLDLWARLRRENSQTQIVDRSADSFRNVISLQGDQGHEVVIINQL